MNKFIKNKKQLEKWGLILMAIVVSVMVFNIRESGNKGRTPAFVGNGQQGISK